MGRGVQAPPLPVREKSPDECRGELCSSPGALQMLVFLAVSDLSHRRALTFWSVWCQPPSQRTLSLRVTRPLLPPLTLGLFVLKDHLHPGPAALSAPCPSREAAAHSSAQALETWEGLGRFWRCRALSSLSLAHIWWQQGPCKHLRRCPCPHPSRARRPRLPLHPHAGPHSWLGGRSPSSPGDLCCSSAVMSCDSAAG